MTYILCCTIICITTIVLVSILVSKPITVRCIREYVEQRYDTTPPPTPIGFTAPEQVPVPEDSTDILGDMMGDAMELFTGGDRIEENKE